MLDVNKKKFGVELCETSHKLLGASQVESSIKKNPCEFSFIFNFLFYMAKPFVFFSIN